MFWPYLPPVSDDIELVYTSEHRERRSSDVAPAAFQTTFRSSGNYVNLKFKKSKWRHDNVPFHYYQDGVKYEHVAEDNLEVLLVFCIRPTIIIMLTRRIRVVSPTFPFAPESFRPLSFSPRVVSPPGRFAHFPVRP